MSAAPKLRPLAKRPVSATLQQKKEADEHALLELKNLHDSWKWIFTILMGGSTVLAAQSVIICADSAYSKYERIPITNIINGREVPSDLEVTSLLFLIYALILFRFYWSWIRYCDLKYIEVPSLIVSYRTKFIRQAIPETYDAALKTAFEYSRLGRVWFDTFPVFFQTTMIFVIAGSLNSAEIFIRTYIILLVFNSFYLSVNYYLPAYHTKAVCLAFGNEIAFAVHPRQKIKIWILNNAFCAIIMYAFLQDTPGPSLTLPATLVFVFVMFANCVIDLICTRQMYTRPVIKLWKALSEF
jgi:hypothetical protein